MTHAPDRDDGPTDAPPDGFATRPAAPAAGPPRLVRTAVFVDFDNIYLGLERQSYEAARQFATNPQRWMDWLRRQRIDGDPDYGYFHRRFLVRRCYLNPNSFSRFRADFTRSAFHVVDCPPLTFGGKTSADIHMVLDVLDTLHLEARVDEFMILSADADFTPVLSRLSRHDRRSVVLAVGPASATYRASCDLLLDQDEFIDELLPARADEPAGDRPAAAAATATMSPTTGPAGRPHGGFDDLIRAMADRVRQVVGDYGDLPARELPRVYREFPEFAQSSDWLGFFGLRRLTERLAALRPDLVIEEDPADANLWRMVVRQPAGGPAAPAAPPPFAPPSASPRAPTSALVSATAPTPPPPPADAVATPALLQSIATLLDELVADAPRPVAVATAAARVKQRFGAGTVGNWLGFGRFEEMLRHLPPAGFRVSDDHPRYLFDPARHAAPEPAEPRADDVAAAHPDLAPLAWRVHQITEVPYLTPERYAAVFDEVAREVGANGYDVVHTSRVVRDHLARAGEAVARVAVTSVLRGLAYTLLDFGSRPHTAAELAAAFRLSVLSTCRNARLELGDEEKRLLDRWLVGGDAAAAGGEAGADDALGTDE